MSFKEEGINKFSNYKSLQFGIEFDRTKHIKSCQISFGGYSKHKGENFNRESRLYKYGLKQLLNKRSKDGYYKDKFILIDGFSDRFEEQKQGLLFQKVFFHFEETYEKGFVIDYLKTLFQEIDDYHRNCPHFKFEKYKSNRTNKRKK
jgi:hypothetical protein